MTGILNLTQHAATPTQRTAGVVEPDAADKALIRETLTFDAIPTAAEINHRAVCLAALAARSGYSIAMIGGAPYLMPALERALQDRAVLPVYAFSRREVVEEVQADGSVRKALVFRHLGFVGLDETRPCHSCDSSGMYGGVPCEACGGTGELPA